MTRIILLYLEAVGGVSTIRICRGKLAPAVASSRTQSKRPAGDRSTISPARRFPNACALSKRPPIPGHQYHHQA